MNVNYFKQFWKSSLMVIMLCFGLTSWGQYTINFDGNNDATHASNYGFTDHNLNGITWTAVQAMVPTSPLTGEWYEGTRSLRLRGYAGTHFTMTQDKTNGAGNISFSYKRYSSDAQVPWVVEYSTNSGGAWTQIGSSFTAPNNNDVQFFSETLNIEGNIRFRIRTTATSGSNNRRLNIDNLTISDFIASTPTQVATPSISATGTENGVDTYWDSADITISTTTPDATIYYTINDGSLLEYVSPFTITSTSTIEAYAEADGLDDSEMATKTITITHTVPTVTASTTNLTGLGYEYGSSTSTAQSFNIIGANLDGTEDVIIAIDGGINSDFQISLDDSDYDYEVTIENFTNGSTPIFVRLKSGLAVSAEYMDMITILNGYNETELSVLVEGTVTPPAPVATPIISATGTANGLDTYWESAEITLATTTDGATIYYTINDGDIEEYESPFTITSTSAIEAYATAEGLEDSESATKTITITNPATATIPYAEAFSNTLGDWTNHKLFGNPGFNGWVTSAQGVTVNGYNQGNTQAWLISPKFNAGANGLLLSFDYASQYQGNNLEIRISNNYSGYGNPGDATWTTVTTITENANSALVNSSLTEYLISTSGNTHIALVYADNSSWAMWRVSNLIINSVTPCDEGTLIGGTTVSNVAEVTSGGSANLSLDGASTGSGLTYQWQSSANGTDWSDIDGATTATYSATNITAATYFRAAVTCGLTTEASTPVQVTLAYCAAGATNTASNLEKISNFTFLDINNPSSSTAGYENFTGISTDASTATHPFSVTISNVDGNDQVLIWIDLNQNSTFDNDELVYEGDILDGTNATVTGNITIPNTATLGNTRLRIRLHYSTSGGNTNPCGNSTYGQVEDYTVNILPACTTATYSFATATESKTTDDEAFTNAFTTNNTSATVFASSNPAVATVHPATGVVSIVGAGTTTISVTQVADGTYCAVSASYELTVISIEPVLEISGDAFMGSTCLQTPIQGTYTITNMGGQTATIENITLSNLDFSVDFNFFEIEPQATAEVTVTYNPLGFGSTSTELIVIYSGGETASFEISASITPMVPSAVSTNDASNVTGTGATFMGTITNLGTCWNPTEYGFVYGTTENPTNANFSIIAGTNPSFATPFQFTLDGVLTPGTTYYYKAYIKNFQGIYVYGNEESFTTTLSTPTATAATTVTSNSFTANWNAVAGATSYEVEVYKTTSSLVEVINQEFDWCDGDGGNDGVWSSINPSNVNMEVNLPNWSGDRVRISSECLQIGTSGNQGYLTTPALGFSGNGTLTFRAGAWDGNSEQTKLKLEISGGGNLSASEVTMTKGAFTSYEVQITEATANTKITFKGFQSSYSRFFLDDVKVMGETQVNTPIAGSPFTVSAPTTSYQVNGLEIGNTYTYNVKAITADVTTVKSNDVSVITYPEGVIWTSGNAWLNDVQPTTVDDVYVLGNLTVSNSNSFTAKTLTVNGSLTIQAGGVVEVVEGIVNQAAAANFVVENDGILLQNTNASNTGAITVKRNSNPMFRLDYTLWSSPVAMNLVDFSEVSATSPTAGTGTLWNRVYTLGALAWNQVWTTQPDVNNDTTPFVAGQGYLYRSPNAWVIRGNENEDPAQAYPGVFTGVPNNGTVNAATPYEFSAIGNPYPSPIDADILMTENADIDYIYFWTNTHAPLDGSYDDVPNNWAYYNTTGGTATDGGVEPNGTIQPGQGFVAKMVNNTNTVNFNNGQRISSNNHFFRQMASERHRFWLNLSNSEEVVFNQILVGYMNNATQGIDTGIDAKMFAYEGNALYSIIENSDENYVIQGRSLPFTDSDVVALGFRAVNAGSFTISLHNFDGLFADNQNIYLKDNFTQAVHNLKDGAYSFVSEEGVFNTRFEVVYQTAMSVENPVANNSNWVVYSQENGFQVQTQGFELKTVQVYDLLGRTIYTANAQGTAHNIPSLGADSVYIVKVTTTENVVLSKKVR